MTLSHRLLRPFCPGRRALLRGAGAMMALPFLEAAADLLPRGRRAAPVRMAVAVVPNGMLPSAFAPTAAADGTW